MGLLRVNMTFGCLDQMVIAMRAVKARLQGFAAGQDSILPIEEMVGVVAVEITLEPGTSLCGKALNIISAIGKDGRVRRRLPILIEIDVFLFKGEIMIGIADHDIIEPGIGSKMCIRCPAARQLQSLPAIGSSGAELHRQGRAIRVNRPTLEIAMADIMQGGANCIALQIVKVRIGGNIVGRIEFDPHRFAGSI